MVRGTPALKTFAALCDATVEGREISTTMAFVRMLNMIIKDKESLPHGSDCYLILLPDGKRAYFSESSLLSLDEWNGE